MDSQVARVPDDQFCEYETQLLPLTPTQRKILDGVCSGQLNKQIAFNLGIAETTVKAHMTAIMRKLNVRNRTQVALVVAQAAMKPSEAAIR